MHSDGGGPVVSASVDAALREAGVSGDAAERLRAAMAGIVEAETAAVDRRRAEQVGRLSATASRATESLELETLLSAIVDDARSLIGADSGDMLLLDRDRGVLRVVAVAGSPVEIVGYEMAFGEGISTQAILAGRAIWTDDYRSYPHRAPDLDRFDFGSVVCVPLVFRGEAIGTLNLHATRAGHRFTAEDRELISAFADHAAIAIDHARRYEREVLLARRLAEANRDLTRSLAVQQRLAEQVLVGGGPSGIATVLARDLGRRVVIQDHIRRVIAGASPDGDASWRGLPDEPGPIAVPVVVGREVAGHLLLSAEQELGPIDRALVDVAVTGVALELAKIRATLEVEERLRGEAIAELLGGTFADEATMAARAARLGHDLGRPHDVLVIDVGAGESGVGGGPGVGGGSEVGGGPAVGGESGVGGGSEVGGGPAVDAGIDGGVQPDPLAVVRERLVARARGSVAVVLGASIVALVPRPARGAWDIREFAGELRSAVESAVGPGRSVTVAIGGPCAGPAAFAPAYRSARRALDVMLRLDRRGIVVGAAELGPYALLLEASSRADLEAFARSALQPLLEHDRRHGADLTATLRAYLEEDRVQRRVAERLSIHPNTVVYRIGRIEALLGRSLRDASSVFDLTLALRVLDVVEVPTA